MDERIIPSAPETVSLNTLATPALVLDRTRMMRNIRRMHARVEKAGVRFRPHLKTCKSAEVAALLQPARGATVSTLAEADYFLEHGISDLMYAVSMSADKLTRIDRLQAAGARMSVIVDNLEQCRQLLARADALHLPLRVLVEIDSDGHRAGVPPEDVDRLGDIARLFRGHDRLVLCGVMTHAGGAYGSRCAAQLTAAAERERDAVVLAANALREAGVGVSIVSIGSTPTASVDIELDGITEMRPGVFVFQDLVMAGLGVCELRDIALSVLTTVIGVRADGNELLVDAGWTALSADRGTAAQAVDHGYGLICDLAANPLEDLIVAHTNQEHGIVAARDGTRSLENDFPVGTRLRILPNHACATGGMHRHYHVVDSADTDPASRHAINALWTRCDGW